MRENPIWLCSGDILGEKKKNKPCIYAIIKIVSYEIPLYARSTRMKKIRQLSIYCEKKHRFIRSWISECLDYQNTTLKEIFIKKNVNNNSVLKN